eukprot:s2240_g7.t1
MVTDFDKKTVGYCAAMSMASAAVSGLSVAAGPALLVGFAGGAGVLWLRQRMFSLQGTYNQDLEDELRQKTSEGFCFTQMGRFVEDVDLAKTLTADTARPSTALVLSRAPREVSRKLPMKLPEFFANCGILLKLERRLGKDLSPHEMVAANIQWLRVQYSKDGLAYRKVEPPFRNTRWQRLEDVRPFDLAQKDSTYNAMTWNAYSVMEMIWTEMEQRSSENMSASHELCQSRESRKADCCYQRSIL